MVDLLTPHITPHQEVCSVWEFKKDPEGILKKMNAMKWPLVLTFNGSPIGIICDPKTFSETEDKRKKLVALLDNSPDMADFKPHIGRRGPQPFAAPKVQELIRCIKKLEALNHHIQIRKSGLYDVEKELKEVENQKAQLLAELERGNEKTA